MPKIITDPKLIDEVLSRGVEKIYPNEKSFRELLMSGRRIKLYCGYDPSAPALHIGNVITLNKLSQFQSLGHEVIFLIGDFTGMIGDPTDKLAARKKLTREEVSKNSKDYKKQASGCLKFDGDNPAKIMHNSEWSDKLDFRSLIELASNFTVQQMITRDMFQKRIREEKPIFLHEFLYPLAQGYDSLMLDVDLEVGGNDQMFNMLCGRDLLKALRGKEKYVMTLKLLADEKGKKMGKSEGNAVFLDQEPEDMYGKIMSWPDEILGVGFELCTRLPMPEVNDIRKELTKGKVNPRDLKMKLAYAVVKLIYDTEAAKKAEDSFIKLFQKKDIMNNVDIPFVNNMPELNMNIINVVSICAGISKSDARRLVKQGGIKYNGKPITSIEEKICLTGEVLEVGKKKFFKPRHGG